MKKYTVIFGLLFVGNAMSIEPIVRGNGGFVDGATHIKSESMQQNALVKKHIQAEFSSRKKPVIPPKPLALQSKQLSLIKESVVEPMVQDNVHQPLQPLRSAFNRGSKNKGAKKSVSIEPFEPVKHVYFKHSDAVKDVMNPDFALTAEERASYPHDKHVEFVSQKLTFDDKPITNDSSHVGRGDFSIDVQYPERTALQGPEESQALDALTKQFYEDKSFSSSIDGIDYWLEQLAVLKTTYGLSEQEVQTLRDLGEAQKSVVVSGSVNAIPTRVQFLDDKGHAVRHKTFIRYDENGVPKEKRFGNVHMSFYETPVYEHTGLLSKNVNKHGEVTETYANDIKRNPELIYKIIEKHGPDGKLNREVIYYNKHRPVAAKRPASTMARDDDAVDQQFTSYVNDPLYAQKALSPDW